MRTYVKLGLLAVVLALVVLAGGGTPTYAWTYPASLKVNAASDGANTIDRYPQVTTDGLGNWVAVWASEDTLGGTIGFDWDILVTRSTDNGATWSYPEALNGHAGVDGSDRDDWPQVTTDGLGNWVAVWASNSTMFAGGDYDILVARSTDGGATWTYPAVLNYSPPTETGADRYVQVTTDGLGHWLAVWDSTEPNVGSGIGTDYDILVARSTDNGATWTQPVALNTNATADSGLDYDPQVTTDGGGNWLAVWYSQDDLSGTIGTDMDILVARSTDNGATWTAPAVLNSNAYSDDPVSANDRHPQVTTDGLGHWVAVWASINTIAPFWDVLVSRSTDNGATWTALALLDLLTGPGHDEHPQVTTDSAGNWLAVWDSNDDVDGAIGGDKDILVSQSTDNGVTWSARAPLNGTAYTDGWHGEGSPQVATDGLGHWVAVWQCEFCLDATLGTDWDLLYATELDSDLDGIPDDVDNCPVVYNADQLNSDTDSHGDACDNCPSVDNEAQTNTDKDLEDGGASVVGDTLGDECDDDDDNDGFDDDVETYLPTQTLDNCAGGPGPGGDAWPLDNNVDMYITIGGDLLPYRGRIGAWGGPPADPNWLQRLDLNTDNWITVGGDVLLYRGRIGESCA
jgi:hypothetical protein